MVPSHGAYNSPISGIIAIPSPNAFLENISSLTLSKAITFPFKGACIVLISSLFSGVSLFASSFQRKKVITKDKIKAITNPITPYMKFMPFFGSINIVIFASPGPAITKLFNNTNPQKPPVIKPLTITLINTFLFNNVTPYNAGSVIPIKAEMPADAATDFFC